MVEARTPPLTLRQFAGDDDAPDRLHLVFTRPVTGREAQVIARQVVAATAMINAEPPAPGDPLPDALAALRQAEAFIAGFEDDPTQDDVGALLEAIRKALARAEGAA